MASGSMSFAIGVMLLFHTYVIFKNWTTFEAAALFDNNIFKEMSYGKCWKATFGEDICLWLIPVDSINPTSGLDYDANMPVGGVMTIPD